MHARVCRRVPAHPPVCFSVENDRPHPPPPPPPHTSPASLPPTLVFVGFGLVWAGIYNPPWSTVYLFLTHHECTPPPTHTHTPLQQELDAPVEYIVLPTFAYEHKIFVGPFSRRFPKAKVRVPMQRTCVDWAVPDAESRCRAVRMSTWRLLRFSSTTALKFLQYLTPGSDPFALSICWQGGRGRTPGEGEGDCSSTHPASRPRTCVRYPTAWGPCFVPLSLHASHPHTRPSPPHTHRCMWHRTSGLSRSTCRRRCVCTRAYMHMPGCAPRCVSVLRPPLIPSSSS